MARLSWDDTSERIIEYGIDRGLLQIDGETVAWPGLTSVTESVEGGENRPLYVDGVKFAEVAVEDDFAATIEAYGAPSVFKKAEGISSVAPGMFVGQQRRKVFDFAYRTRVGNANTPNLGYKIHIVYNALTMPAERSYTTVADSTEAIMFSWEISAVPPSGLLGYRPTAHITIDSTKADPSALAALEMLLYGGEGVTPRIPSQQEIVDLLTN